MHHRCGSDLVLLWLRRRLVGAALIIPRAWEFPKAVGKASKRPKKKKKDNGTELLSILTLNVSLLT